MTPSKAFEHDSPNKNLHKTRSLQLGPSNSTKFHEAYNCLLTYTILRLSILSAENKFHKRMTLLLSVEEILIHIYTFTKIRIYWILNDVMK